MPFPYDVAGRTADERGMFSIQEPDLRARILPLFAFDPEAADERPQGRGTAFRIDPWSRCATAFHVMEDLFEVDRGGTSICLKPDVRLIALDVDEYGFGRLPIPEGGWRSLSGSFSFFRVDLPFAQPASLRNLTELMVLRIRLRVPADEGTPYFPVDLRRWRPSVGERVMAIGYPDLDAPREGNDGPDRPFSQYLHASIGEIVDVEPADGDRGRPWPLLRVSANWPGGMSGGPVFNELGEVIGLVSTGFEGEGGATATYFSGWDLPMQIFGSLDPDNAGRFMNWGAFDADGALVRCGQDKAVIKRFGEELGLTDFGLGIG